MIRKNNIFIIITIIVDILFFNCGKEVSNEPKIGVVLPLTGDIAPYGQSSKNGMEIAIQEFKNELENNQKLDVYIEDGKGLAKESVNSIKKLININKVPVVLGGIASSIALAMSPVCEQSETVLMCPFASSPKITYAGDYIFRIMPSDAFQAELLPQWLEELNYSNIAIIYVKNDWGESLKNAFTKKFEKMGGNIVFEESCIEGSKDVRNILVKLKENSNFKTNVDALFLPTYPEEGGLILKQLQEMKINKPVFGGDTWANDLLIQIAGQAAEGAMFLAPMQYEGKEFQQFQKKYINKFNKEPDLPASAGYDAMKVVLLCINNIISSGNNLNGKSIKNSLYNISGFIGATGITTFDKNGDVISKEFSRRIIKNGKIKKYESD